MKELLWKLLFKCTITACFKSQALVFLSNLLFSIFLIFRFVNQHDFYCLVLSSFAVNKERWFQVKSQSWKHKGFEVHFNIEVLFKQNEGVTNIGREVQKSFRVQLVERLWCCILKQRIQNKLKAIRNIFFVPSMQLFVYECVRGQKFAFLVRSQKFYRSKHHTVLRL